VRLGDGTEESRARMQAAVDDLHPYREELFTTQTANDALPDRAGIRGAWEATVNAVFDQAGLEFPDPVYGQRGGRTGEHGEVLGHMLAPMQYLQRAHPGAKW
jgi:ring-1,2-phenylacetyl-CoA epoxidase subunit PaaC